MGQHSRRPCNSCPLPGAGGGGVVFGAVLYASALVSPNYKGSTCLPVTIPLAPCLEAETGSSDQRLERWLWLQPLATSLTRASNRAGLDGTGSQRSPGSAPAPPAGVKLIRRHVEGEGTSKPEGVFLLHRCLASHADLGLPWPPAL
jgi:hypothetical protein